MIKLDVTRTAVVDNPMPIAFDSEVVTARVRHIPSIKTKVGFSLYEDGKLRTLEPVFGTKIQINGKTYEPFDFYATNIHADNNSMWFDKEGNIIKLKTVRGELVEF